MSLGFLRRCAEVVTLAAFYYLAARLGQLTAIPPGNVTAVWPASGIALAAILLRGNSLWPGIVVGCFFGTVWAFFDATSAGRLIASVATAAGASVGATLQAILGAALIRRWIPRSASSRVHNPLRLVGTQTLSCLVSPTLGVTSLCLGGFVSWNAWVYTWLTWWAGDLTGVLLVFPAVKSWSRAPALSRDRRRWVEGGGLAVFTLAVTYLAFIGRPGTPGRPYPVAFLVMPFLIWAAVRFDQRGVSTLGLLVSTVAISGTALGMGEFAGRALNESLLLLQLFTTVVTLTGLALAAALSDRRRAQQRMEENEKQLRLFVEHTPAPVAMFDRQMRYLLASRRWLSDYGLRSEDLAGRSHYEVFPEINDMPQWKAVHQRCLAGAVESCEEDLFPRRDGTMDWVRWGIHPWRRAGDDIGGIIMFTEVITERKRAQEALRERERAYATLLANLSGMAYRCRNDENWTMELVSDGCLALTGYPAADLIGNRKLSFADLIHPEDQQPLWEKCQASLAARRPCANEYRIRTAAGEEKWVRDQAQGVYSGSGELVAVEGLVTDISDSKRLEDQLRQSQRMEAIGLLAGGVAHDFNNLLTVITGYSGLALESIGPGHKLRAMIEEIQRAGDRASLLTQQLLAFSRRQSLRPEVLDLNAVIAGMYNLLRRLIGEDIEIVTRMNPDLGRIQADRGQIEQVILNLAVNARDAMPQGGKLILTTTGVDLEEKVGPQVLLCIEDTGSGMDEATRSRIFEPFFTTKEKGKGTGLGLATVHGIIQQSGGHIGVSSEPGRGTRFEIYLPCTSEGVEEHKDFAAAGEEGSETILLTEDEPALRALVRRTLARYGYQVLEASHGEDALEVTRRHPGPIDLLLTDVVMPLMSGRELASRLVALRPATPVLFMSGYDEEAVADRGLADSSFQLLHKPFTPDGLARKVRETLDLHK